MFGITRIEVIVVIPNNLHNSKLDMLIHLTNYILLHMFSIKFMIFVVEDSNFANITFNGGSKVTSLSETTYLVKWFLDEIFIGEMDIAPGCWACFPLEIGNWKVEFWRQEQLINTYDNTLKDNYILFVAKFQDTAPGKSIDIKKLEDRVEIIQSKYECKYKY